MPFFSEWELELFHAEPENIDPCGHVRSGFRFWLFFKKEYGHFEEDASPGYFVSAILTDSFTFKVIWCTFEKNVVWSKNGSEDFYRCPGTLVKLYNVYKGGWFRLPDWGLEATNPAQPILNFYAF